MTASVVDHIDAIRPDMLRFAVLQLRDAAAAEDAVQEALLAALEGGSRFQNRAQVKTWVFGILKHKIVDIIRRRVREPVVCQDDEISADAFDPLFDERGHWRREERPADWGDPERALENAQFWAVFDACLNRLPPSTSRLFMMREFLELDTGEICKELKITSTNCWVVLHRARMSLRLCLEAGWFGDERRQTC